MNPNSVRETAAMNDAENSSSLTQQSTLDTQKMRDLGPFFYKLPTEIRLMIFEDCITSGHRQFMQASRALQNDAQGLLFKHGVYRIQIGSASDINCKGPTQKIAKGIENVDIRVDMTQWKSLNWSYAHHHFSRLKLFTGSRVPREQCDILLRIRSLRDLEDGSELFYLLWRFEGFEKVLLRIEVDPAEPINNLAAMFPNHAGLARRMIDCKLSEPIWRNSGMLDSIYEDSARLGKSEITETRYGFCRSFYPRKHSEAVARGAEA